MPTKCPGLIIVITLLSHHHYYYLHHEDRGTEGSGELACSQLSDATAELGLEHGLILHQNLSSVFLYVTPNPTSSSASVFMPISLL